jgi:metal-responsive CopG/Arc/MetJ family transcriptional regulator
METIQVVLDKALLKATDETVRRMKTSRSALVRDALRAHLASLFQEERERRDRDGYARFPESVDELFRWDRVADWPEI